MHPPVAGDAPATTVGICSHVQPQPSTERGSEAGVYAGGPRARVVRYTARCDREAEYRTAWRVVMRCLGLSVIGTVRVLALAEDRRLVERAAHCIEAMATNGYRISRELLDRIRQDRQGER